MPDSTAVSRILDDLAHGDAAAAERLFPVVYDELRVLAGHLFRGHRPGATLQPTALVHEAYLKLIDGAGAFENRAHVVAVAAKAMRHILVDRARRHSAARHGGGRDRVTLDEALAGKDERDVDVLALDEALSRLAELDQRKAQIVELRFFGGLGIEETAVALGIARSTVTDDWRFARAWLARELGSDETP